MSITKTLTSEDNISGHVPNGAWYTWNSYMSIKLNDDGTITFNSNIVPGDIDTSSGGSDGGVFFCLYPTFRFYTGTTTNGNVQIKGYKDINLNSLWRPSPDGSGYTAYKRYTSNFPVFFTNKNVTARTHPFTFKPATLYALPGTAKGEGTELIAVTPRLYAGDGLCKTTAGFVEQSNVLQTDTFRAFWSYIYDSSKGQWVTATSPISSYVLASTLPSVWDDKTISSEEYYVLFNDGDYNKPNQTFSTYPTPQDVLTKDPLAIPLVTVSQESAALSISRLTSDKENLQSDRVTINLNTKYQSDNVVPIQASVASAGNGYKASNSSSSVQYGYIKDSTLTSEARGFATDLIIGTYGSTKPLQKNVSCTLINAGDKNANDGAERAYRPCVLWGSSHVLNLKNQDDTDDSSGWIEADKKVVFLPPPKPAADFTVTTGPGKVTLKWTNQQIALGLTDYIIEVYRGAKAVSVNNGALIDNGCTKLCEISSSSNSSQWKLSNGELTVADSSIADSGSSFVYSLVFKSSYSNWQGKLKESSDLAIDGLCSPVASKTVVDRYPPGVYVYKDKGWHIAPTIVTKV